MTHYFYLKVVMKSLLAMIGIIALFVAAVFAIGFILQTAFFLSPSYGIPAVILSMVFIAIYPVIYDREKDKG